MILAVCLIVSIPLAIFVHELGHVVAARLVGVKVPRTSVGFGPLLFTYRDRFATHWDISLFLLGGYSTYAPKVSRAGQIKGSTSGSHRDILSRLAIYCCGPIANLLFSIVILLALAVEGTAFDVSFVTNPFLAFPYTLCVLSVAIGLFNLLPIPPFDGWLICCLLYELLFDKPFSRQFGASSLIIGTGIIFLADLLAVATLALKW